MLAFDAGQSLPAAPTIRALVCDFHTNTRKRSRSGRYTTAVAALIGSGIVSSMEQSSESVELGGQRVLLSDETLDEVDDCDAADDGGADGVANDAASLAVDDDSGDVEVVSVHRVASSSSPTSSSARRQAEAQRWEQLWRDKQWRVRQLANDRERDNASASSTPSQPTSALYNSLLCSKHSID